MNVEPAAERDVPMHDRVVGQVVLDDIDKRPERTPEDEREGQPKAEARLAPRLACPTHHLRSRAEARRSRELERARMTPASRIGANVANRGVRLPAVR